MLSNSLTESMGIFIKIVLIMQLSHICRIYAKQPQDVDNCRNSEGFASIDL